MQHFGVAKSSLVQLLHGWPVRSSLSQLWMARRQNVSNVYWILSSQHGRKTMIVHRLKYRRMRFALGTERCVVDCRIDSWWLFGIVPLFYKTKWVRDVR